MKICVYWLVWICIAAILSTCVTPGNGEGNQYRPARFTNSGKNFLARIDFPETDLDGSVIVRGAMPIDRFGEVRILHLYSDNSLAQAIGKYEDAVRKAFRSGTRMVPAIYNGRRVSVWFSFSVVFTKNESEESLSIHPSYLYHVEAYGEEYSSPQRLRDPFFFPRLCLNAETSIWIAVDISEDGKPTNPRKANGAATEKCEKALLEGVLDNRFIPAQLQGENIEGTFLEAWFTG